MQFFSTKNESKRNEPPQPIIKQTINPFFDMSKTTKLLNTRQALELLRQVYTEQTAKAVIFHHKLPVTYFQSAPGCKIQFSADEINDFINSKLNK